LWHDDLSWTAGGLKLLDQVHGCRELSFAGKSAWNAPVLIANDNGIHNSSNEWCLTLSQSGTPEMYVPVRRMATVDKRHSLSGKLK